MASFFDVEEISRHVFQHLIATQKRSVLIRGRQGENMWSVLLSLLPENKHGAEAEVTEECRKTR